MRFKAKSELCGCGAARRPGQRTCRECHAEEMRARRDELASGSAAERIGKTLVHVARGRTRRELPPEFKAKLEAMAAEVAAKIETFNAGRG